MADVIEPVQEVELETFPSNIMQSIQNECNAKDDQNTLNSDQKGSPDETNQITRQAATDTFSCLYFFLDVFSIVTYLVDVGSDIWVAYLYYRDGDWWWFSLTVTFIISPCLLMSAYSVYQCVRDGDSCCQIIFAICVTTIPGGAVVL